MSDLIIITTHAIQYQVPLFQYLAQKDKLNIEVVFLEEPAVFKPYWDIEFNREIKWDIPLVDGYRWSVVPKGNLAGRLKFFTELHAKLGKPPIMLISWGTHFHWMIWTWAITHRIPVLLTTETNRRSYLLTPKPVWRHYWLKYLIRHTHGLLYIGTRNKEFYVWMGADSSQLFPYPYSIDNDRFQAKQKEFLPTKKKDLLDLELNPQLPTFLFCGKLIPKKRPDLLLEAVHAAHLNGKVNILFVGDGILRSEIEKMASTLELKNVAFQGFLNQQEMPKAYSLGDVLCLLSDQPSETWGLVVNEAMACGCPVIVSEACGCVPDLVEDKGSGWVVKANNLDNTSRLFIEAYEKIAEWDEMGKIGQYKIKDYSFKNMAKGIQYTLEQLQ